MLDTIFNFFVRVPLYKSPFRLSSKQSPISIFILNVERKKNYNHTLPTRADAYNIQIIILYIDRNQDVQLGQ